MINVLNINSKKSKIAIIGANARSIAESATLAGYETYLIDYFSDLDTLKAADHVFSMQKNPLNPNFREEYSREKLVDFAIKNLKGKVDNVLVTSSIGSDHRMIEKLKNYFKILGNSSGQVKKARDWKTLMEIFYKLKIKYPKTLILDCFDDLKNNIKNNIKNSNIYYPFVIKPSVEKEFQTRLVNNEFELNDFLCETKEKFKIKNKKLHGRILIQEFVSGTPVSSSVLSNGKKAVTLSINRQLIGIDKLNAPSRFTYCGHITPMNLNLNLNSKISKISNKIISELGLAGSVGIDFVLKNNEIYFMEINPRFQDTLESVEKYRNINQVDKHLDALDGKLDKNLDINFFKNNNQDNTEKCFSKISERNLDKISRFSKRKSHCFAKGILFAKRTIKMGDLSNIHDVHDIPKEGTIIQGKEPICSISVSGKDESEAVKNLFDKVELIKKEFY